MNQRNSNNNEKRRNKKCDPNYLERNDEKICDGNTMDTISL